MASAQPSARAVHQLSRAALSKAPLAHHAEARNYHRLLKEHSAPKRLMQGFNTTSTSTTGTASPAHFHTSAPLPASPVDSVLFPQTTLDLSTPAPEILRMPRLPQNSLPPHPSSVAPTVIEPVIKPEIHTVSADSTYIASPSAMSEVTDNHAMDLDVYDLPGKVVKAAKRVRGEGEREVGMVKELWEGILDDLMGPRKGIKV